MREVLHLSNIPITAARQRLDDKHIQSFLAGLEQEGLEVNSLVLLHNGASAAEFWREPYRQASPQVLFSLSKSFTSIAVGIAWDAGYLQLDDPVIRFFPDKLPTEISPNLAAMTVHHLLAMNTGQQDDCYPAVVAERDWVKAFLALPVNHKPGTFYRYNTPASHVLAAIVERVTGQALVDFLQPRLFTPLDIPYPEWERNARGVTAGGMGLSLTTEAVARFGQMLLNKGVYKGQRIVSEAYITRATSEQSDNRRGETRVDYAQGYGYQFFLCRRGCYMGTGAFGQLCFVAPAYGIVVAATAALKGSGRPQQLLELIYRHLLDPLDNALPDIPASLKPHSHQLGGWYRLAANPERLRLIGLDSAGNRITLRTVQEDGEKRELVFDTVRPVSQRTRFIKDIMQHEQEAVTQAVWNNPDSLTLTVYYIETPYIQSYTITFAPEGILLDTRINVSFTLQDYKVEGVLFEPQVGYREWV